MVTHKLSALLRRSHIRRFSLALLLGAAVFLHACQDAAVDNDTAIVVKDEKKDTTQVLFDGTRIGSTGGVPGAYVGSQVLEQPMLYVSTNGVRDSIPFVVNDIKITPIGPLGTSDAVMLDMQMVNLGPNNYPVKNMHLRTEIHPGLSYKSDLRANPDRTKDGTGLSMQYMTVISGKPVTLVLSSGEKYCASSGKVCGGKVEVVAANPVRHTVTVEMHADFIAPNCDEVKMDEMVFTIRTVK